MINLKDKDKKEYIHFSIESDFKREVEKLASENKLKVASYIKWLLNKEIQNKKSE